MERMICYSATARDGRRYVGITKRTLEARRAQHEREGRKGRGSLFQRALGVFGPETFVWEVLAEGREDVVKVLEGALISRWELTGWRSGFNGKGGLYDLGDAPPEIMEGYRDFEHEIDNSVAEIELVYDLEKIVDYLEKNSSETLAHASKEIRDLGERLVRRANRLGRDGGAG